MIAGDEGAYFGANSTTSIIRAFRTLTALPWLWNLWFRFIILILLIWYFVATPCPRRTILYWKYL